jgi:hypothetical protein
VPAPPGITIKLRGHAGAADRELALQRGDFAMLRQIAGGQMEIKACEREYRRLQSRGLARHTFRTDKAGFPHAYAVLTGDGEQALAQAPGAAVA